MYWFRENPLQFIPWLVIALLWLVGGWLLATHSFRLEKRERLVIGIGLGLLAYMWLVNLLGHWLTPYPAFTLSGLIVLLLGIASAWNRERPLIDWRDLKQSWMILAIGLLLIWIFLRIGKGLSLFDEHKNLSLISTMAAGDIPPHYYINSTIYYAYHYAFQILGASLMRLGGLTPWSAFDLSKALIGAYGILLAYLLGKRYTAKDIGGVILAMVVLFAMGTRYLLLLLPPNLLQQADNLIVLQGSAAEIGVSFSKSLVQPWLVDGGPPFPFQFAFLNGITSWPHIMVLQAGPSALALVIFLLLWLLYDRSRGGYALIVLVTLFAMWALAWETSYGLFVAGWALVTVLMFWKRRDARVFTPMTLALLISIPIVIFQGGIITEIIRSQLVNNSSVAGTQAGLTGTSISGVFLRWPPAIVSSHLGSLRIFSPLELLVALIEIGPILFFTPWITIWAWKRFRNGDWFMGALILSSWIGFLTPIFIGYKADRDITRLMAYGIQAWVIMLVLLIWDLFERWNTAMKTAVASGLALMVFGGIVVAGSAFSATSQGVLPFQFIALDAQVSAQWWDKLEPGSEVFDPATWRSAALLGRLNRTSYTANVFAISDVTKELRKAPTIERLLDNGYNYIYIDENWWEKFTEQSKSSLSDPCVQILAKQRDGNNEKFRMLLDLTQCK